MRFWRSFAAALDVRPGEGQATALLFVLSFVLGLARPLISTAANAIYLSKLDPSSLPYLYIGIAIIVTVEGLAVSMLQRRLAFATFLVTVIMINIAALCVAWFLIAVVQASWVALGLAIWNSVVGVLTGLVFWGLAGRIFDVRQAKRLFGLVGSGEAAAGVIAGASASWLVTIMGTPNLLLAAASGLAVFLALLLDACQVGDVTRDQLADLYVTYSTRSSQPSKRRQPPRRSNTNTALTLARTPLSSAAISGGTSSTVPTVPPSVCTARPSAVARSPSGGQAMSKALVQPEPLRQPPRVAQS